MLRHPPTVFTEYGVAMLSGVLNSARAVQVNIAIMRIFMKFRSFLMLEKNLSDRMSSLEKDFEEVVKSREDQSLVNF